MLTENAKAIHDCICAHYKCKGADWRDAYIGQIMRHSIKFTAFVLLTPKAPSVSVDLAQIENFKRDHARCDKDLLAKCIKSIPYHDFLNTWYWQITSGAVRMEAGFECQSCYAKNTVLQVHHKTYERHGFEFYWRKDDLICLCERCHQVEHGMLPRDKNPQLARLMRAVLEKVGLSNTVRQ